MEGVVLTASLEARSCWTLRVQGCVVVLGKVDVRSEHGRARETCAGATIAAAVERLSAVLVLVPPALNNSRAHDIAADVWCSSARQTGLNIAPSSAVCRHGDATRSRAQQKGGTDRDQQDRERQQDHSAHQGCKLRSDDSHGLWLGSGRIQHSRSSGRVEVGGSDSRALGMARGERGSLNERQHCET